MTDSRQLQHPEDAQSDLIGVFSKCIEVKTHTVDVTSNCTGLQKVKVIANKKKELEKNQLYLRVNKKQNSHGLVRSISYFIEENGLIHNNCIILQYFINTSICRDVTEINYKVAPHGSYYPSKKSTINCLRDECSSGRKRKISNVYDNVVKSTKDEKDLVPSLGQKNKLLTCNSLQQHQAVIIQMRRKLCWHIMRKWKIKGLSVNHGAFEVTPVPYRHQLIESRSKNYPNQWVKATVVGPTIIHHEKTEKTFDTACRVIARKTGLMNKKVGIVTDGETALINACANNFMSSIGLRCTSHFKTNCKDFLKSVGITSDQNKLHFWTLSLERLVSSKPMTNMNSKSHNVQYMDKVVDTAFYQMPNI